MTVDKELLGHDFDHLMERSDVRIEKTEMLHQNPYLEAAVVTRQSNHFYPLPPFVA